MTEQERALLIYAANVLKEHISWSPTGPRVSDKIKEMIVAAQSPAELQPVCVDHRDGAWRAAAEPEPSVVSDEAVNAALKAWKTEGVSFLRNLHHALEAAAPYICSPQSTDTSYMVEQANKLIDQVKERDAEIERLKAVCIDGAEAIASMRLKIHNLREEIDALRHYDIEAAAKRAYEAWLGAHTGVWNAVARAVLAGPDVKT